MKLFGKKKLKCKLCPTIMKDREKFDLNVQTAEGRHTIIVCAVCAETMEKLMKANQEQQWDEQ
jgi:RNase P subunit RPR2